MPGKERRKKEADRLRKRQQENAVDSDTTAEEEAIDRKHPTPQQLQALQLQREARNIQRYGSPEVLGAQRMQQQHEKEAPMRRMQKIRSESDEQKEARQQRISHHRMQEAEKARRPTQQSSSSHSATTAPMTAPATATLTTPACSSSTTVPYWVYQFRQRGYNVDDEGRLTSRSQFIPGGYNYGLRIPDYDHPLRQFMCSQLEVDLWNFQHGNAQVKEETLNIVRERGQDLFEAFVAFHDEI